MHYSKESLNALSILSSLFADIELGRPSTRRELRLDYEHIRQRVECEGIEFLTSTLPQLGKAVLRALETGHLDIPHGFKRAYRGAGIPRLLWVLLSEIFDERTGNVRCDLSVPDLTEVLQVTMLCYKLKMPISEEKVRATIQKYLDVEDELSILVLPNHDPVLNFAEDLISTVFANWETSSCVPRHGPGHTATRECGDDKWFFKRKFETTEPIFPAHEYFFVNPLDVWDRHAEYKQLEKLQSGCSRMAIVPKDSRGPRLISLEPLELQYFQQGIRVQMQTILERHPITSGCVNFTDQSVNARLALSSSSTKRFATLDMSEASDRVSCELVRRLFGDGPLTDALFATRSTHTLLPNGRTVKLHKMSPMGSAVCFPVESIVHFALAVAAIHCEHGLPLWRIVGKAGRRPRDTIRRSLVYVYGDDIIVDRRYVDCVLEYFPRVGLKFNVGKCFIHGKFRESCGTNAINGIDVTPIYWREPWDEERASPEWCSSQLAFASGLYAHGFCKAAETVWLEVEKWVGKLPTNPLSRPVGYLTRVSRFQRIHTPRVTRYNVQHQNLEHKCWVVRQKQTNQHQLEGPRRLLRNLVVGSVGDTAAPGAALTTRWMGI